MNGTGASPTPGMMNLNIRVLPLICRVWPCHNRSEREICRWTSEKSVFGKAHTVFRPLGRYSVSIAAERARLSCTFHRENLYTRWRVYCTKLDRNHLLCWNRAIGEIIREYFLTRFPAAFIEERQVLRQRVQFQTAIHRSVEPGLISVQYVNVFYSQKHMHATMIALENMAERPTSCVD